MPHEGYADNIMNDRPRFHLDMPISELTEHIPRAIEASDVSSTPLVVETTDGVMFTKTSRPSIGTPLRAGARGKLDSQGDRMRGHRMMARILGRGYVRKLRIMFLKRETLYPTSFAIVSLIFSETRPRQQQGVRSHSEADKGIYTLSKIVTMPDPFS